MCLYVLCNKQCSKIDKKRGNNAIKLTENYPTKTVKTLPMRSDHQEKPNLKKAAKNLIHKRIFKTMKFQLSERKKEQIFHQYSSDYGFKIQKIIS